MKAIKKILFAALGIAAMWLMLSASQSKVASSDMESARGSSPSPSYTFELQIFHAF